jgi:hypothetical protein
MPHDNRSNFVQFLTSADNALPVLEILKNADNIRAALLSQFWKRLYARIEKQRPTRFRTSRLDSAIEIEDIMKGEYGAYIRLFLKEPPKNGLSLFYQIEHRLCKKSLAFELYYGLYYSESEVKENSPMLALKEVKDLELRQRELEFDEFNPSWHGLKYLGSFTGRDEFLENDLGAPGALPQSIADNFWNYIEQTHELVAKANRALETYSKK